MHGSQSPTFVYCCCCAVYFRRTLLAITFQKLTNMPTKASTRAALPHPASCRGAGRRWRDGRIRGDTALRSARYVACQGPSFGEAGRRSSIPIHFSAAHGPAAIYYTAGPASLFSFMKLNSKLEEVAITAQRAKDKSRKYS